MDSGVYMHCSTVLYHRAFHKQEHKGTRENTKNLPAKDPAPLSPDDAIQESLPELLPGE